MDAAPRARALPCGDAAVLVELGAAGAGDGDAIEMAARVLGLERAVAAARIAGVVESIPGLRSLLVEIDPALADLERVAEAVLGLADSSSAVKLSSRSWLLPVCFDLRVAPDLAVVSETCGIAIEELVRTLCECELRVAVVGHLPGLPYLVGLPPHLDVPRLKTPRTRVDAGAVGVAARMACVYPNAAPGGWQIVGRTPAQLLDPRSADPVLLRPGDRLRFTAVEATALAELAARPRGGIELVEAERGG